MMQVINSNTNCALMNPSCTKNISLGFPQGQVHSNMPLQFPNIVGENNSTEYQDCRFSQVFLPGESPWESNLEGTCPQARDKAKMRYNEKKKTRMYVPLILSVYSGKMKWSLFFLICLNFVTNMTIQVDTHTLTEV